MKIKKKSNKILIGLVLIFIGVLINNDNTEVNAERKNNNLVNIYFFHSTDCFHCKSEKKLLDSLEDKYSNIRIYRYEIHEKSNYERLTKVQELYDIKTLGVPLTIIGATPYSGYKEEKNTIEFIKTFEYYSRYSYEDKVGQLLEIKTLPNNEINNKAPTLEEFTKTYGNYQLIGELYTDDIDISAISIILGILSQLNIIKIVTTLIAMILLSKIEKSKDKILLLAYFLIITFILLTIDIFSNNMYTIIISLILLYLFIIGLIKYNRNKKKQHLYGNIFMLLAIISNILTHLFSNKYNIIFKDLMELHNLTGIAKITYYINYIFSNCLVNILIVLLLYNIKKIIRRKLVK